MANHKSALKRQRQSEKKRVRNAAVRSTLRKSVKGTRLAITEGKAEAATASLATTTRLLDKAVSKGVIHKNNAARKISRLTRQVNSVTNG
ncbi:MAG: 30S ribosomal protein S20 [Thermodesulfobacteriota bacterium]